jgi:hypothetical protein
MSYLEDLLNQKKEYYQRMEFDSSACLKFQEIEKLIRLETFLNKNDSSIKTCKIVVEIPCLYQGWEHDEWAWIIEIPVLIATNCGSPKYLRGDQAKKFLMDLEFSYQGALNLVNKAKLKF